MTEIKRTGGGQWAKGTSGNPSGRPPKAAQEVARLIGEHRPELVETTVQMALQGDMQAMKILFDRIAPPLRATAQPVEIDMPAGGSLADKARAVLAAAADGKLPGDTAAQLITAVGSIARVVEIDEITERLDALEAMNDEA